MFQKFSVQLFTALTVLTADSRRDEKGATALEYAGMIIIAALVVTAIVTAINPDNVKSAVESAVGDILQ